MHIRKTFCLVISLSFVSAASYAQDADIEGDEVDLTIFQQLSNIADDGDNLMILDRRAVVLSESRKAITLVKVLNTRTNEEFRLSVGQDNTLLEPEALFIEEESLRYERYGSLQAGFADILRSTDTEKFPVMIQFAVDDSLSKSALDRTDTAPDVLQKEFDQNQIDMTNQINNLVEDVLNGLIDDTEEVFIDGPFLSTTLSKEAILKLSRDPRIVFIGPDQEQVVYDYPTIPESLPATGTQFAHSAGAMGQGINIVVLEGGTPTVSKSCFNLKDIQDSTKSASDHMTKSLAILGNRYKNGKCDGTWIGYAPKASVYLANHSDYKQRYKWARGKNVNVVTMSWHFGSEETNGSLHSRDRYFDYWSTRWPYPMIFTSAGNEKSSDAYSSGKGYNFFGVGNILNDDTDSRCDDTMSSSSSDKNPVSTYGHREVPEIASPGSRHELLDSSFGGTSAATPVTAAISAVLMSENPDLRYWPEGMRAILLATSNYQGADGDDWRFTQDGSDGTGMTNAHYGKHTAARRESGLTPHYRAHDYGFISKEGFDAGFFEKTWKAYTARLDAKIRVAFTWNSETSTESTSSLNSDLDLRVYDPDGALVAWSVSWDNNIEFVEFEPKKKGSYEIKIRGFDVPEDFSSYYGVAWTTHYDNCD